MNSNPEREEEKKKKRQKRLRTEDALRVLCVSRRREEGSKKGWSSSGYKIAAAVRKGLPITNALHRRDESVNYRGGEEEEGKNPRNVSNCGIESPSHRPCPASRCSGALAAAAASVE